MKKYAVPFLSLLLVFCACTTNPPVPQEEQAELQEIRFVPQILPDLSIPSDVGTVSVNPADTPEELMNAFRDAYVEALCRGIPLAGVLGSDRVSRWPEGAPEGWNQNWTSTEPAPNSWGIPDLVLALGNYKIPGSPVYTVYGAILDMYGKSGGYNRANGAAGYGIPLGEVFFEDGAAVQRFSRGRMILDKEGGRFVPGEDSLYSRIGALSAEIADSEGEKIPQKITGAFAWAWAFASEGRELQSDGPAVRVNFSHPWILETAGGEAAVNGFYFKTYDQKTEVFVVLDGPGLPVRAHRINGPILSVLLNHKRIPGLGREKSLGSAGSGGILGHSLAGAFALYGVPLSDILPMPADLNDSDGETPLFEAAQRFSRGWIIIKALPEQKPEYPVMEENNEEEAEKEEEIDQSEISWE